MCKCVGFCNIRKKSLAFPNLWNCILSAGNVQRIEKPLNECNLMLEQESQPDKKRAIANEKIGNLPKTG